MSELLDPMHRRHIERLGETSGRFGKRSIETFLAHYSDPGWWTQTIAFTAVTGRVP